MCKISLSFPDGLGSWVWLFEHSKYITSIISASAWYIWKAYCEAIFRKIPRNTNLIACRAVAHVKDFSQANSNLLGKRMLLNNFPSSTGLYLFSAGCWNAVNKVGGFGFFFSTSNYSISFAGCGAASVPNALIADLQALSTAIRISIDRDVRTLHIFIASQEVFDLICSPSPPFAWRITPNIEDLRQLLAMAGSPGLHVISHSWNAPAIKLAPLGLNLHVLTLFLLG